MSWPDPALATFGRRSGLLPRGEGLGRAFERVYRELQCLVFAHGSARSQVPFECVVAARASKLFRSVAHRDGVDAEGWRAGASRLRGGEKHGGVLEGAGSHEE